MEAWRNLTVLNYTAPALLPSWLLVMNETTDQWRFSPFTGNLTVMVGYLDNTTVYPNGTVIIEGAGSTNVGSKTIQEFVYMLLSLLIILAFAVPFYAWINGIVHPSEYGEEPGTSEADFWRTIRPYYQLPLSKEEIEEESDGGQRAPLDADAIQKLKARLREMHRMEIEIWAADGAVGVDQRDIANRRRKVNEIWREIRGTVRDWDQDGGYGAAGLTQEERQNVRAVNDIVRGMPETRYPNVHVA